MRSALFLCLLCACSGKYYHQYDHGRCYDETLAVQSDLERESAQDDEYELSGEEGLELRERAAEAATDEETTLTVEKTE